MKEVVAESSAGDRGKLAADESWLASVDQPDEAAETILLVDDDAAVRSLVCLMLESYAFNVLVADRAEAALKIIEGQSTKINLVLSDIVMPGWNGRQLGELLRQKHPTLKVLYMSGYVSDSIIRNGMMRPDVPFLPKPFDAPTLVRKVREVLDQGSAS